MKQNITIEQLIELDYEIQTKLGKRFMTYNQYNITNEMTIGNMIEILFEKCFVVEIYKPETGYDTVAIQKVENSGWVGFDNDELCDALFEACKLVL